MFHSMEIPLHKSPLGQWVNNPISHTPASPTQTLANEQTELDFPDYFVLQDLGKCTA